MTLEEYYIEYLLRFGAGRLVVSHWSRVIPSQEEQDFLTLVANEYAESEGLTTGGRPDWVAGWICMFIQHAREGKA